MLKWKNIIPILALLPSFLLPELAGAETISISSPSDLTLPAIPGTGGSSSGSVTWTVATDALLGYKLEVHASSAPAMSQDSYTIADYHAAVPATWSVAATDSEFGFSAEGPSTPVLTWGTPGSGSGKYRGFNGSNDIEIARRLSSTTGEATTVYFKVEVGASHFQVSGTYTATITATATSLI